MLRLHHYFLDELPRKVILHDFHVSKCSLESEQLFRITMVLCCGMRTCSHFTGMTRWAVQRPTCTNDRSMCRQVDVLHIYIAPPCFCSHMNSLRISCGLLAEPKTAGHGCLPCGGCSQPADDKLRVARAAARAAGRG